MEATRRYFGEHVSIDGSATTDDVFVWVNHKHWILDDDLREIPPELSSYSYATPELGLGFEIGDFGDRDRLAWPGGACAIPQGLKMIYGGDGRFAMWHRGDTLAVVDATRSEVLRLTCPPMLSSYCTFLVHAKALWIAGRHGVVSFPLDTLGALFDQAPGPFEIRVLDSYPARDRTREVRVRVTELGEKRATVRSPRVKTLEIPIVTGLEVGMDVILRDLLWADLYMEVELPDQKRRALFAEPPLEATFAATLAREPAIDPAGELVAPAEAPSRQAEIDRLLGELSGDPGDVASRSIFVDALEDAGEPYAPLLAALVAGEDDPTRREQALGPLANYLDRLEYRGGLPWSAWLRAQAPRDPAIGEAVAADQRLGLFHALRLGDGPYDVYARLVGSVRAVGLRHVDVPNQHVLAALIAGGRYEVTHLYNVRFSTRKMIDQLAHTTFDRVQQLETETTPQFVAKLFDFLVRDEQKIFARAPRHLVLRGRIRPGWSYDGTDELVGPVMAAWDRLPLAAITVGGITLRRDGARTVCDVSEGASAASIGQVRARFPA